MSELVTVVMEPRTQRGKGASKKLRKEGFTPCVFYGPEMPESVAGKIDTTKMSRLLSSRHWETMRLMIKLPSGDEEMCIVREVQRHPISGKLIHVDFMRLIKGRKITVNVPVRIHGKDACPGIKEGGVLENLHEIEVETLPVSIPDFVDVDISNLLLGEMIHVKDLDVSDELTILADPDEVVAIVVMPKAVEETVPGEEREVEVMAKGKAAKGED